MPFWKIDKAKPTFTPVNESAIGTFILDEIVRLYQHSLIATHNKLMRFGEETGEARRNRHFIIDLRSESLTRSQEKPLEHCRVRKLGATVPAIAPHRGMRGFPAGHVVRDLESKFESLWHLLTQPGQIADGGELVIASIHARG